MTTYHLWRFLTVEQVAAEASIKWPAACPGGLSNSKVAISCAISCAISGTCMELGPFTRTRSFQPIMNSIATREQLVKRDATFSRHCLSYLIYLILSFEVARSTKKSAHKYLTSPVEQRMVKVFLAGHSANRPEGWKWIRSRTWLSSGPPSINLYMFCFWGHGYLIVLSWYWTLQAITYPEQHLTFNNSQQTFQYNGKYEEEIVIYTHIDFEYPTLKNADSHHCRACPLTDNARYCAKLNFIC